MICLLHNKSVSKVRVVLWTDVLVEWWQAIRYCHWDETEIQSDAVIIDKARKHQVTFLNIAKIVVNPYQIWNTDITTMVVIY